MAILSFPAEVNERAARIVAGVVASSIALGIAFDARPVVVILAIGFWLRAGFGPRISPLARLAVKLAPRLGPAVLVPGLPKRFAQTLGDLHHDLGRPALLGVPDHRLEPGGHGGAAGHGVGAGGLPRLLDLRGLRGSLQRTPGLSVRGSSRRRRARGDRARRRLARRDVRLSSRRQRQGLRRPNQRHDLRHRERSRHRVLPGRELVQDEAQRPNIHRGRVLRAPLLGGHVPRRAAHQVNAWLRRFKRLVGLVLFEHAGIDGHILGGRY